MPEPGEISETGIVRGRAGATAVFELARPEKFNCLSGKMHHALDQALTEAQADHGVRAVLIAAQGKHFCTGADLAEVQEIRSGGRLGEFIATGHQVLRRLEASPLPVVVAVQGLCLAGGLELALAGDVIFAGQSTRFGDQHAQFGLVPGWGGTQRLTRRVGLPRALDLMYTARWLDADEARDWGLANYVVPDTALRAAALDYCAKLAARSRAGLAAMKRLARGGLELPLHAALELEAGDAEEVMLGPDVDEGLAAFSARRAPRFD